ncbi:MAG: hypothetical protein Q8903_11485 [Bacteroidota bacterium]|nr:hypothetical protein [Bacteroidota bacterium]
MTWYYTDTGFNTGEFNMQFDLALSKNILPGQAILRFYRWEPFCISLGFNQSIDSIDYNKAKKEGIGIVKRPTGGRAVLHAEELTYSVVMPCQAGSSPKIIYKEINEALKLGIEFYNKDLTMLEFETAQPNFQEIYKEKKGLICFATPAKNELKYAGKKIAGSAQRKIGNIILQHGSILCGTYHKKIIDYLSLEDKDYSAILDELNNKTIEIETVINKKVNYDELKKALVKGFESFYSMQFLPYQIKNEL